MTHLSAAAPQPVGPRPPDAEYRRPLFGQLCKPQPPFCATGSEPLVFDRICVGDCDPHAPARLKRLSAPWDTESAALGAAAAPRSRFGSVGEVLQDPKIHPKPISETVWELQKARLASSCAGSDIAPDPRPSALGPQTAPPYPAGPQPPPPPLGRGGRYFFMSMSKKKIITYK